MDKTVTTDGLLKFSETCILAPSLLARRLRLDDSTIEQIQFSNPNDRYEQIYQMLLKWKQNQPDATWKDLQEATDSGVKRALSDIEYRTNGDSITTPTGHDKEREEYGPPASKVAREDSPLPSAPPFDLIYPVQEESNDDNVQYTHSTNITMNYPCMNGNGVISAETNHEVNHNQDKELTYDDDYSTILNELGHETKWFEIGLALRLKPSLLDEIKVTNREKISDCRKEMMKEWLKNPRHTSTWRTLCTALRQDIVGNKALADRIARKYKVLLY